MTQHDQQMHYPEHHHVTSQERNAMARGKAHMPHALPLRLLITVAVVLLFFTWLTVAVTYYDFGYDVNLTVAIVIALIKACVVALFFMHLKYDAPLNGFILCAALFFVSLFIWFTLVDTGEYAHNYNPPAIVQPAAP